MENKQRIKCDVKNCRFNNHKDCVCNLNCIKVGANNNDCHSKEETICNSFKYNEKE